jgi:hypothetical protein
MVWLWLCTYIFKQLTSSYKLRKLFITVHRDRVNPPKKLTELGAFVPTTNGGGKHRHTGMIVESTAYTAFSNNGEPFKFNIPTNPGPYPTMVSTDVAMYGICSFNRTCSVFKSSLMWGLMRSKAFEDSGYSVARWQIGLEGWAVGLWMPEVSAFVGCI